MRLFPWWRTRRGSDDVAEEIKAHLDMAIRERIERGMPADAARDAALREFGNVALVQQTTREMSSWTSLEQLLQDLRFGARILWQAPGLSATAIVLTALVIGGNTTIYSIVNALLVSPAPGITAERLVSIKHVPPGAAIVDPFVSYPNYRDYARLATTVNGLAAWSDERLTVRTATGNYAVLGSLVTPNYFETFGVAIAQGRGLRDTDDERRDGLVAVISDRLWRERFDQTPDIVGTTLLVNNVPATIVGVAAPEFAGVLINLRDDLWLPIAGFAAAAGRRQALDDRTQPMVIMVGQRAAHASMNAVRAEFETLSAQIRAAFPDAVTTFAGRGVVAIANPGIDVRPYSVAGLLPAGDMAPRFLALFSVVTLLTVLVVAANVANLMLGRAVARQRDMAVRRSLGASRTRMLRLLLAEGAAIATVAWAASCAAAWATARIVLRLLEPGVGALSSVRPDWTLALYAMLLAGAATVAFTLMPAVRAWKLQILPLLRRGEHSIAPARSRLSNALVVMQLACSVLLLTSAGLAYRSLTMLDSGHVGFDPEPMLLTTVRTTQELNTGGTAARDRAKELARLEPVRARLGGIEHITAVSYARRVPGAYFQGTTPVRTREGDRRAQIFLRTVGPDYLGALGLAPVAGRDIAPQDRRGAAAVAVVSAGLARELFPDTPAVGRTLLVDEGAAPVEIVGVTPDALFDGPVHDPHPRYVFLPLQQAPEGAFALVDVTFFVRYSGTLEAITPVVSRALADADATLPIVSMSTMRSRLDSVTVLERQITLLLVGFALTSLVIATVGQYASAMFNMRRRTRDFGVRLALGASAAQIQGAVVRESLVLTVPGLALGFLLSVAAALLAQAVLFGVTPVDPATYFGVLALLALTSVVASYLPAWHAGRVDVIEVLRHE